MPAAIRDKRSEAEKRPSEFTNFGLAGYNSSKSLRISLQASVNLELYNIVRQKTENII